MFKKMSLSRRNTPYLFFAISLFFFVFSVSQTVFAFDMTDNSYLVERIWSGGKLIDKIIVPGRPPKYFRAPAAMPPEPNIALGINTLANVPAFDWSYGCSATSAAMMAGYYDNNGYPNMYAGSGGTPAGVCPMDNSEWGSTTWPSGEYSECPLSATHLGIDDRVYPDTGHVDDYWVDYGSEENDPYITGGWPEHTYADCTGDFMKTNQSAYENEDGSTSFFFYTDGSPTYYADLVAEGAYGPMGTYADYDGGCGLADFFTSRGYIVTTMYSQYIQGIGSNPSLGFTFADFQSEIDAGRPVLIQVADHTMLGYGYSTTGSVIYIHDTWDYSPHTMTWGGYYYGLLHYGVTVLHLDTSFEGTVSFDANSYSAPDTAIVTVQDSDLDENPTPDTITVGLISDTETDTEIAVLTETGNSTGIFTGSINLELNAVPTSDSVLQVQDEDTITVTYLDADHDGEGTPATLTDTAMISLISVPTGLTATAGRNYVFLYWGPVSSPVLVGYNVCRSTSLTGAKTKINGVQLIDDNTFQDLYLSLNTTYYYWVTAVDIYDDETDYSQVAVVTTTTGEASEDETIAPDGGSGSSSGGGAGSLDGCFIATASYGTPMAKEVRALSQFRDEYLLSNSLGRFFVGTYYKFSPQLAEYISRRPMLKKFVRIGLKPLVRFSEKMTR